MRMKFAVTYEDGREVEAVAKPKDFVAFERTYGQSMAVFDESSGIIPPLEWLFYLAWSPLHRQQREPLAFDDFLTAVEDIKPIEEDEEPTPFPPTAPEEPSPT